MYAVVKVGGKQHRVSEGDFLTVDRMPDKAGDKVSLVPLLLSGDNPVFDADGLKKVKVEAVVQDHHRGKKIRVFKFKPKSGYKKTKGHRSELTRLQITSISTGTAASKTKTASTVPNDQPIKAESAKIAPVKGTSAKVTAAKGTAAKNAPAPKASAPKATTPTKKAGDTDGS